MDWRDELRARQWRTAESAATAAASARDLALAQWALAGYPSEGPTRDRLTQADREADRAAEWLRVVEQGV